MNATLTSPSAGAEARVVSQAACRAASALGLSQAELAEVLGVDASLVSRLVRGERHLQPTRKAVWERALLFIRLFRSLDGYFSGQEQHARAWLAAPNTALNAAPASLLVSAEGLVRVLTYVDAHRARV